jgi:hypothetical protein
LTIAGGCPWGGPLLRPEAPAILFGSAPATADDPRKEKDDGEKEGEEEEG